MKAYIYKKPTKSTIKSVEVTEGETLEEKVQRIIHNNEPITDGAPEIFTPKEDGVIAGFNIRTDRWEIAAEAMDLINASTQAKRDNIGKLGHQDEVTKAIDGGAEPTHGSQQLPEGKGTSQSDNNK